MAEDSASKTVVQQRIQRLFESTADIRFMMRIRRILVSRDNDPSDAQYTGTNIPAPFNTTNLALRTMIDAPASAAQHYASRIASNLPDIEVTPISRRSTISAVIDKQAGEQERIDSALWESMGGREEQWKCGWGMSLGGVSYYLVLPRDADFGLPDRIFYDDLTEDEIAGLQKIGKSTLTKVESPSGKLVYAEPGDVWAARRKEKSEEHTISGRSLFTLRAFPRDMCVVEKDSDGVKWGFIVEEVPGDAVDAGSELARSAAKMRGIPEEDIDKFGIFLDKNGRIIGGISHGGPADSDWKRPDVVTVVRYFDRVDQVFMVAPRGSVESAYEVFRSEHGCKIEGIPACPLVEVPFFRTDIDIPRKAFATPLDKVFAYAPLINQLETLLSNAAAFDLIPRWVVELKDGSILRGEDGEPKIVESGQVPGLNPNEAAAYPGTLRQLTIQAVREHGDLLKIYLEQLAQAMPSPIATGASGASGAAWTAQTLIQQAQETLRQPVDNHARAVQTIIKMCHSWLRELDVPIYFTSAPGYRKNRRSIRGVIEFDPKNFTDSIYVTQELDTPEERTVRIQVGMGLWQQGAIDDDVFYTEYMRTPDARQAVIDRYVQMIMDYVIYGKVPAGANPQVFQQSLILQVADGVRGAIHQELLSTSPNYALASARQGAQEVAQQAQMMQQQLGVSGALPPPGQGGSTNINEGGVEPQGYQPNLAYQAGIRRPGVGMAESLQQQIGPKANIPGVSVPAGAPA
jgi:hypothetical protein